MYVTMNIYQIVKFCNEKQINNIYLFPHKNPDADALGSSVALSEIFNSLGFYSKVIIQNDYEDCGLFDVDITECLGIENFVAIFCDCSRTEYLENDLWKRASYFIKIDHHDQKSDDLNKYSLLYVDEKASSTCEIVTFMLKNSQLKVDKAVYDYLYYGILTDTGKFTYAINGDKTFLALSWLILKGANYISLHERYNLKNYTTIKIHAYVLNNMEIHRQKTNRKRKIAICQIPQKVIMELDTVPREFSKAVNVMSNIEYVDSWYMIVETKNDKYVISARSSESSEVNVEEIVREFGGGGHFHSAGCIVNKKHKDKFIEKLINTENK